MFGRRGRTWMYGQAGRANRRPTSTNPADLLDKSARYKCWRIFRFACEAERADLLNKSAGYKCWRIFRFVCEAERADLLNKSAR